MFHSYIVCILIGTFIITSDYHAWATAGGGATVGGRSPPLENNMGGLFATFSRYSDLFQPMRGFSHRVGAILIVFFSCGGLSCLYGGGGPFWACTPYENFCRRPCYHVSFLTTIVLFEKINKKLQLHET